MDTTRLALLRHGYATAAPDGDARFLLDSIDALSERIAALEAAVATAWAATQSIEMTYEDIATAVETALGPVLDPLPPPPAKEGEG